VPCPMRQDEQGVKTTSQSVERRQKRVKLMSKAGREVVGPGY
jgi:hypothetical protein